MTAHAVRRPLPAAAALVADLAAIPFAVPAHAQPWAPLATPHERMEVHLTDRVRLKAGLPQRYGTQLELDDDRFVVQPVEEPEGLAERRAALCLLPLDLYLMASEEAYGLQDHGLLD